MEKEKLELLQIIIEYFQLNADENLIKYVSENEKRYFGDSLDNEFLSLKWKLEDVLDMAKSDIEHDKEIECCKKVTS